MSSEERVTAKNAAAEVLPAIMEARLVLAVHQTSIKYVLATIDKKNPIEVGAECYAISRAIHFLESAEYILCQL